MFRSSSPYLCAKVLRQHYFEKYYAIIDAVLWDFGDNTTSTLANPVRIYTLPGVYSVTLTVESFGNPDTLTKTEYITVEPVEFFLPIVTR